jgi:hypothetical protein
MWNQGIFRGFIEWKKLFFEQAYKLLFLLRINCDIPLALSSAYRETKS